MKIRTIALSTFGSFLRNKIILLFCSLFVCIVLLTMFPLMSYKSMTNASNAQQMQGLILNEVAAVMSMVSGFGSLLAAWAAADSVAGEMKSGTILAVMARPLRRWEFLAGKYLGVLMLMAVYVLAMFGSNVSSCLAGRPALPYCLVDAIGLPNGALCHLGGGLDVAGHRTAPDSGDGDCGSDRHADPGLRVCIQPYSRVGSPAGAQDPSFNGTGLGRPLSRHDSSIVETLSVDRPRDRLSLRARLRSCVFSSGCLAFRHRSLSRD